ncbi:hypothetical protein HNP52_001252 [Sphingomonas kyeonggiensis]|uniref:DUF2793 domain-containing protein n=1 Tax=Sphingomonas kyeonggiensis TaxID=1268553 RepID=A0A7W7NRX4_9SPHN|nr:DUF2793 domain-containing protein [Sphingomonas kyeonggiensis]MBB4838201.1 hypothetical protein [Sphingomonas kyeonggiensis]
MTEITSRLALPLLDAGQAQKEIHHNEALVRLDLLVQATAEAMDLNIAPETPAPGQCWIVGTAPMGAWSGHGGDVAGWTEGGWRFATPREGMRLWLGHGAGYALFRNGEWHQGEAHGRLVVEGQQVVGAQMPEIAEPEGGTVVDAPARAAISAVIVALRAHGLIHSG